MKGFVNLFPLWALLASASALVVPELWTPLGPAIAPLLGLVMLGMGLTLSLDDFRLVLRRPALVLLGVSLQFLGMPLLAWGIAKALALSPALATGLILVGCAPGGTASNVIAYLAKADVALSVCLTAVSTCLAVVMTPLLATVFIGQQAPVPTAALFGSVLKIVLIPVALGTLINTRYGQRLDRLKRLLPVGSVAAIVLIIAIIVALNRSELADIAPSVVVAVALHNLAGLGVGYLAASLFRVDEATRRTLALEIGMQNSGLGVALAKEYFGLLAALPGAVFSVWHNLTGSLLASYWSRHPPPTHTDQTREPVR